MTQSRAPPRPAHGRAAQPLDAAIGAILRLRRRQAGVSQQQLAEALGISWQQVRKYETGRNRIAAATLVAAAEALRCRASSLLPEEPPTEAEPEPAWMQALKTPGALELLEAFSRIHDARRRTAVVAIAQGLAREAPPPAV
jgi:transcriptional regulator with XRE-family HTH domain